MAEVVGYQQLQARLHALGSQGSSSFMRQLGLAAVREQKLLVPRRTSTLGRSIVLGSVTNTSAVTVATAPYAAFVEFGTGPHEITPKAKLALRWAASSSMGFRLTGRPSSAKGNTVGWVFAKRVHHPGTKAHPYMIPGAKIAVQKTGVDAIVEAWNSAA